MNDTFILKVEPVTQLHKGNLPLAFHSCLSVFGELPLFISNGYSGWPPNREFGCLFFQTGKLNEICQK